MDLSLSKQELEILYRNNKEDVEKITGDFSYMVQISDANEAKEITALIKLFINKKRDFKFQIQPTYSSLIELCSEFCNKVQPIIRYLLLRLNAQGKDSYYKRWWYLLHSIDVEGINNYYVKLNGSYYGKTIIYRKLHNILEKDCEKIHDIILLVYALSPYRDKPIKQQTIGLPSQEFEEMFEE